MKHIAFSVISSVIAFTAGYALALRDAPSVAAVGVGSNAAPAQALSKPPLVVDQQQAEELAQLAEQLSDANKKIDKLQRMNSSLSRQIGHMDLPIPASTTYPELLNKIDMLPVELINKELENFFGEEYTASIEDPYAFSKQVVEVVLEDQEDSASSGSANIEFSFSPVSGLRYISQPVEIDQHDTVYAHLEATENFDNCIVKWQHVESGEVLLLKQMSLRAGDQSRYVWVMPSHGWAIGSYRLTLHDMDNDKQLVGSSSMVVANVIAGPVKPNEDVIQDLILSGQAIPK